VRQYGVRFGDGSVRHPWNGYTQLLRAVEEAERLRSKYTPDKFTVVCRDSLDQQWQEFVR
jgi:hypothetical protein